MIGIVTAAAIGYLVGGLAGAAIGVALVGLIIIWIEVMAS